MEIDRADISASTIA